MFKLIRSTFLFLIVFNFIILANIRNVLDYDVIEGDSSEGLHNASKIQYILDHVLEKGETLYFPHGEYRIDACCILKYGKNNINISGDGIGKTFIVRERLAQHGLEEGDGYILITTHITPGGLYCLLHDHQRQTIVFDDCDSVFANEQSVNLLKAALDSYETRKICWPSMGNKSLPEGYEDSFEFEGNIGERVLAYRTLAIPPDEIRHGFRFHSLSHAFH